MNLRGPTAVGLSVVLLGLTTSTSTPLAAALPSMASKFHAVSMHPNDDSSMNSRTSNTSIFGCSVRWCLCRLFVSFRHKLDDFHLIVHVLRLIINCCQTISLPTDFEGQLIACPHRLSKLILMTGLVEFLARILAAKHLCSLGLPSFFASASSMEVRKLASVCVSLVPSPHACHVNSRVDLFLMSGISFFPVTCRVELRCLGSWTSSGDESGVRVGPQLGADIDRTSEPWKLCFFKSNMQSLVVRSFGFTRRCFALRC